MIYCIGSGCRRVAVLNRKVSSNDVTTSDKFVYKESTKSTKMDLIAKDPYPDSY